MPEFSELAITNLDDFIYGRAPRPVTTRSGMVIGGGTIYPELNFTLPTMQIEAGTMAEVRSQYTQMIDGVCGVGSPGHGGGVRTPASDDDRARVGC